MGRLAEAPFYIDDNAHLTVMEMRAKCRRLKALHGDLGLIVVDYLQLMSTPKRSENRQVEVSELSRGLKVLARDLETPVMALSQLNRSLEYRTDKRPMLADLRESGALEQDSDVVAFIYRDEAYNPDSTDKGTAEIIVAKHRNGPTGKVRLAFLEHLTKFANMTRHSIPDCREQSGGWGPGDGPGDLVGGGWSPGSQQLRCWWVCPSAWRRSHTSPSQHQDDEVWDQDRPKKQEQDPGDQRKEEEEKREKFKSKIKSRSSERPGRRGRDGRRTGATKAATRIT